MDTRPGAVLSRKTGVFHAGAARALDVAGHWGVPVGAQAFTGNLTVTAQTGVGFISVSPAQPVGVPGTSTSTSRSATTGPTAWSARSGPGPAWARRGSCTSAPRARRPSSSSTCRATSNRGSRLTEGARCRQQRAWCGWIGVAATIAAPRRSPGPKEMPCVAAPRSEPPLRRSSCSWPRRPLGRSMRPRRRPHPAERRRSRPRTCTSNRRRIASTSVPRSTATWPTRPTVERAAGAAPGKSADQGRPPDPRPHRAALRRPHWPRPSGAGDAHDEPPIGNPGFDGLSRSSGPDTNGEPPDPVGAVGPDHVMQIINSSFRMTDRQASESSTRVRAASSTRSGSPSSPMPCGSIRTSSTTASMAAG